ncbi:MAG: DUF2334 domain-containing protein [Armatimonadota bacterium]|nr:DUF2334 domain-containing protein [Armatimonadota bacterium]MDW8155730.1 DUF2334 domain-containing protein [Armatimonadota bacterium]
MPCVVVSVHDVAPPYLPGLRALLSELDRLQAFPRVLKVVPNLDGRFPLHRSAELVDLLRAEGAAGSEVVLHGYTHRTSGPLADGWTVRLRAAAFAPHDAEFVSVGPAEALRRLQAGLEELNRCGLRAYGFCAPGWLGARWLPELLRASGFRYHVTMGWLHDLVGSRRVWTPWFGSVGTGGVHELLVHVGGAAGAWAGRTRWGVVKAFFHPQRPTWAPQLERLRRALRRRRPVTYAALLDG